MNELSGVEVEVFAVPFASLEADGAKQTSCKMLSVIRNKWNKQRDRMIHKVLEGRKREQHESSKHGLGPPKLSSIRVSLPKIVLRSTREHEHNGSTATRLLGVYSCGTATRKQRSGNCANNTHKHKCTSWIHNMCCLITHSDTRIASILCKVEKFCSPAERANIMRLSLLTRPLGYVSCT